MRLIPFDSMTDIHVRLAKASEATLPVDERRQSIRHVEQIMGRELTDAEAKRFAQVASIAPQMVPGDDPIELRNVRPSTDPDWTVCEAPRRVRRLTMTSGWTTPGIKGGEQHSGADVEDSCVPLIVGLVGAAIVIVSAIFLR